MTSDEKQEAPELSQQDRVELRQLAELILETEVNDRLFDDLVVLSSPILEALSDDTAEEESSPFPPSGWHSFAVYSAASAVLGDLLLPADRDPMDELEDQKLKTAAQSYGSEDRPVTDEEIEEIASILEDRFGEKTFNADSIRIILGDSVPEFLRDAREFGWLDPAAVEGAVSHFADDAIFSSDALDSLLLTLRDLADNYREDSVVIEVPHSEVGEESVEGDLSPDSEEFAIHDEGEWGLAEIDGEGESDGDSDFIGDHDHVHPEEVHDLLFGEHRGPEDYQGNPADDQERAMLLMLVESVLRSDPSDVLVADLLDEAGPLILKGRTRGISWWMGRDALDATTDLLARVVTGEELAVDASGNLIPGQLESLRKRAKTYPLDPVYDRRERLRSSTREERYSLLLNERLERKVPQLAPAEIISIGRVIADHFAEKPTRILAEDISNLLSDSMIHDGRTWGWGRGVTREIRRLAIELLLGIETSGWSYLDPEDKKELNLQIRTYGDSALSEDEFIAHYDQSRWPSIGATVDLGIFTIIDGKLQVLLIERGNHPDKGKWALPGGFVNIVESLDDAAVRELEEETGVDLSSGGHIEQVKTYGYPGRDRRGYIITTLYAALISDAPRVQAGDDAAGARFIPVEDVLGGSLDLAFDHSMLIRDALERVRAKIEYAPVAFDFLPSESFTLEELRRIYEIVWGFEILPSDFTRRISEAQGAIAWGEGKRDGKALWVRGSTDTFFPPLDRRQVARAVE